MADATSRRFAGLGGLAALALLFLGVVMLSNLLVRGVRLALVGIASFKKKDAIATAPSGLIVPRH